METIKRSNILFSNIPNKIVVSFRNHYRYKSFELVNITDNSGKTLACIPWCFSRHEKPTTKISNIEELKILCQDFDCLVMQRRSMLVDHKLLAAAGRLIYPLGLIKKAKFYYTNYLKRYRKRAFDVWFDHRFFEPIYNIPESILSRNTINHALEKVYQTQNTELQAFLLNYKWSELKIKQVSVDLPTLQPTEPNTFREIQKNWHLADVDKPELSLAGYRGPETDKLTLPQLAGKKPITRVVKQFKSPQSEIVIPEGYKTLDPYAFKVGERNYWISKMKPQKIFLPHSMCDIGEYAFKNCQNLSEINLKGEIKVIKEGTFENCSALEGIILCDTIRIIGNRAFHNCKSLISINIPKYTKVIGDDAFSHCEQLESLRLPKTIRTIGKNGFSYCKKIKSIHLPYNINKIGKGAFSSCSELELIKIPVNIRVIENDTFRHCTRLKDVTLGKNVKSIKSGAFFNCSDIKTIVIPDNLRTIEKDAFKYCGRLQDVALGKNVEVIENGAFAACLKLKSLYLPASVKKIGRFAFEKSGIIHLSIDPNNPTYYVKSNAVYDRKTHKMVVFPPDYQRLKKKKKIEQPKWIYSDSNSDYLKLTGYRGPKNASLTLPTEVDERLITHIGKFKCTYSEKIARLIIPEGYQTIDYYAFAYLKIKSVNLPDSLVDLGREAFKQCRFLEEINLGQRLRTIKPETFLGCKALKRINIPNAVKTIEKSAFDGCKQLEEVDLGMGVQIIGDKAFANCINLKKIKLPENLKEVSPNAFINSGLDGVDLKSLNPGTLYTGN